MACYGPQAVPSGTCVGTGMRAAVMVSQRTAEEPVAVVQVSMTAALIQGRRCGDGVWIRRW